MASNSELEEKLELTLPRELRCPISGELMEEPVIAEDGHTYDRKNLERYLLSNKVRHVPSSCLLPQSLVTTPRSALPPDNAPGELLHSISLTPGSQNIHTKRKIFFTII